MIDGAGAAYHGKARGDSSWEMPDARPFLLFLIGTDGVTLRDTTYRDSAYWTVRLSGCEDVLINSIKIRGDMLVPNCDGIDLDRCRRVRVSDCNIICPDDGISIKGCREFDDLGPCEDIGGLKKPLATSSWLRCSSSADSLFAQSCPTVR